MKKMASASLIYYDAIAAFSSQAKKRYVSYCIFKKLYFLLMYSYVYTLDTG